MKLIIDIPKELKSEVYRCGVFLSPAEKMSLIDAINNGTPIPDNATNGDVINTMFDRDMAYNITSYVKNYMLMGEWLNAPYQKGGKE